MKLSWLDDIEAAADRGSRCNADVNPLECDCAVCGYRLAKHDLAEGK